MLKNQQIIIIVGSDDEKEQVEVGSFHRVLDIVVTLLY